MSAPETVEIVNCHAEGEVGDVIVGGVEPRLLGGDGRLAGADPDRAG